MSCILHQGTAVLHYKGTWTSIMSDNINHCHLHLVYVSDDPKTHGTFFPIEPIPVEDPKTSSKSDKKKDAKEPSPDSKLSKDIPDKTPSKPARKNLPRNHLWTVNRVRTFLTRLQVSLTRKACPGTISRQ